MNDQNINNNDENNNVKSTIKVNGNLIVRSLLWLIPFLIFFYAVSNYTRYIKNDETINNITQNVINDFKEDEPVDNNENNGNAERDYERDFSQTGDKEFCVVSIVSESNIETIGFVEKTYKFKSGIAWESYLENPTSKPDSFMEIEKYNCLKKNQDKSYSEMKQVFDSCFEEFGSETSVSLGDKIIDKSMGCYMYNNK